VTETTNNPWLNIPLDDYEGHMAHPGVGQAGVLADLLEQSIARWAPSGVAIIGCAGGNGLDRINPGTATKVVAVDLNPHYIQVARERHAPRLPNLELICADIQSESLNYGPVDFTYAALLFEYVDVTCALRTLQRNSRPGAVLTTVLQLPHPQMSPVTPSPFRSLGSLASHMRLVAPADLGSAALAIGFVPGDATAVKLPSGKEFHVQSFIA
jgi:hypothetical protein